MAGKPKARKTSSALVPVKSPSKLAAKTKKAEPRTNSFLFLPTRAGSTRVTEETAMTCDAVYACIHYISESLAALPFHCFRKRSGDGADIVRDHIVDWLVSKQANPETTAFIFREVMIAWALGCGNGYAEIERDGAGRPVWLWQLMPGRVYPERREGRIVYVVLNPLGYEPTILEAEDVIHLKGLGPDGLVGYPMIQLMARTIAMRLSGQESSTNFFENDSTPGGVLKHPMRLSETAADNLRKTWQARHAGPSNRRTVAILEEGMTWEATAIPAENSQTVELLGMSVTAIARWFRVPPHKIGDLSKSSFNNIESENISAVVDCLMPWAKRFESELNVKLFGRTNRGTLYVEHNFKGLLRGDTEAQTNHITQMMDRGVYSVNEARDLLGLNPIGSEGDKRYFPLNFTLLEKVGEDPPEPSPQESPNQPDPDTPDVPNPKGENQPSMAPWRLVLEHACGRVARREMNAIRQAKECKAGPEWIDQFLERHADYMRSELMPVAEAISLALNLNGAGPIAVEAHVQRMGSFLRTGLPEILTDSFVYMPLFGDNSPEKHAGDLLAAIQAAGATNA